MNAANTLRAIISESLLKFIEIPENSWDHKPSPAKWSKKEILGHLTDSAHNNLRRFIVTQYDENNKIIYLQDDWVKLNAYQEILFGDIILLWKTLNLQMARVIEKIPAEEFHKTCDTGKQGEDLKTLEFLIEDYIVHLKHHLNKIFTS